MNITLYKYTGERERLYKALELIKVLQTTGEFKADTSLLSPSLLLTLPAEGMQILTDEDGNLIADVMIGNGDEREVLDFNYFYIEEFRRYYYLSSLVVSSGRLVIITGEVDPLYSFYSEIRQCRGMVERNQYNYDPLLEDPLLPLEMEREVAETEPAAGALVNTVFKADHDVEGGSPQPLIFTISISGIGGVIGEYDALGDLPAINTGQAGDVGGQLIMTLDRDNVLALVSDLTSEHSSLATFFKNLTAFPYEISEKKPTKLSVSIYKYDADTDTYINTPLSGMGYYTPCISDYRVVADFTIPVPSSFLDYPPYSHYEIYLPFFGWYEIKYAELAGKRLVVYYSVNYSDGSGEVYLYNYTDKNLIFSSPVQVGISLSLTSTNAEEIAAQKNAAQLNLILGLIGSGVGIVGSAVSGNVLGAVGSGLSAVSAVTSYVNKTSLMFERAQSTHNGAAGGLYAPLKVRLRKTSAVMRENLDLSEYAHQVGRPLRQAQSLQYLTGFTQVTKIHLDGVTATQPEKDIIESSLLSGILL